MSKKHLEKCVMYYKRRCKKDVIFGLTTEEKASERYNSHLNKLALIHRCPLAEKIRNEGISEQTTKRIIARDGKAVFCKDMPLYELNNRFKNMVISYSIPCLNELAGLQAEVLLLCRGVGITTIEKIDLALQEYGFRGLVWNS